MEKHTILVVDDLFTNRMIIGQVLKDKYRIIEAENGRQALDLLKTRGGEISLIITDNHMPVMSGLEFLRVTSANPWLSRIPVIMTSSDKTADFVDEAYSLGVADFFFTPITPAIVRHRVEYTLSLSEKHKEEIYNALHCTEEDLLLLMQIDLATLRCRIIDTSEAKDMWDKDIPSDAASTIRLFTSYGYIHEDELDSFLKFADPTRIKQEFLNGKHRLTFKYRRKYRGAFRWAYMEVTPAVDFSEKHPLVNMISRDIQDAVDRQETMLAQASEGVVYSDHCNLTTGWVYHSGRTNCVLEKFDAIDTVPELLKAAAELLPLERERQEFLRVLQPAHLMEQFDQGVDYLSVELMYRSPSDEVGRFRVNVHVIQNRQSRDYEAIFQVVNITKEHFAWLMQSTLYSSDFYFVGQINEKTRKIYIVKSLLPGIDPAVDDALDYDAFMEKGLMSCCSKLNRQNCRDLLNFDRVRMELSRSEIDAFPIEGKEPNGDDMGILCSFRYLDREMGILLCAMRNITATMHRDTITDGLTRQGFEQAARTLLRTSPPEKQFSVLYFDICNFKTINEYVGMEEGNAILRRTMKRLQDMPMHPLVVGRLMADRFVCLIEREKIDYSCMADFCIFRHTDGEQTITVRLQCGICHIEDREEEIVSICDKARTAEQNVTNEFNKPYEIYRDSMNEQHLVQMQIMNQLFGALERDEFCPFYQPIFDAKTGEVASAEVLVRWKTSENNYISPALFIPALEKNGAISRVDFRMAQCARAFLEERAKQGKKTVKLSVNLSRMDFLNEEMLTDLVAMVEAVPVEHQELGFEITESACANVEQFGHWAIDKLRGCRCRILIDDFGSGYSSLADITKRQFDVLKMDMSFVREIGINKNAEAVVRAAIDMAHGMGAKALAEGVETERQYRFLRDHGCDYIQGYYFSKPLPQSEFEKLLDQ